MTYFWPDKIVSTVDTTITLKGGEQIELTPDLFSMLVSDKALTPEEFLQKKYEIVMFYMSAAYAQPFLTESEFMEWVRMFWASLEKKRLLAITTAMWLKWDTPELAMSSLTYKDIIRNLPTV